MYKRFTFEQVVSSEAFTVLDIFHHVVSKFVHMSGCPGGKKKIQAKLLIKTCYKKCYQCLIQHKQCICNRAMEGCYSGSFHA